MGAIGRGLVDVFLKLAQREFEEKAPDVTTPPFAVRKELWFEWCRDALEEGDVDRLQFLMMTSALIGRHQDSGFNRLEYVCNVIRLYNDPNLDDKAMEKIFFEDIIKGSQGTIIEDELNSVLSYADRAPKDSQGSMREEFCAENGTVQRTYSALPKEQILPMLRWLRQEEIISWEQAALVLCINLHAREQRSKGSAGRYLKHPMAVAGMVLEEAQINFDSEHDIAVAVADALLHDTLEKSNYDPYRDYVGILPSEVVDDISVLTKDPEDTYFEYNKKCGQRKHTALVKWKDPVHNCLDAKEDRASFKQRFIYPLTAAYEKSCFLNPSVALKSVKEFAIESRIYDETDFNAVDCVSNAPKGLYNVMHLGEIESSLVLDRMALSKYITFKHLPLSSGTKTSAPFIHAYPHRA